MTSVTLTNTLNIQTYRALRGTTGWGMPDDDHITTALSGSFHVATAWQEGTAIGMVRIISDGALNAYVADLVVAPAQRGEGIGARLLLHIIRRLAKSLPSKTTIGLMSAHGVDDFYTKLGFRARPNAREGAGFQASLGTLVEERIE